MQLECRFEKSFDYNQKIRDNVNSQQLSAPWVLMLLRAELQHDHVSRCPVIYSLN